MTDSHVSSRLAPMLLLCIAVVLLLWRMGTQWRNRRLADTVGQLLFGQWVGVYVIGIPKRAGRNTRGTSREVAARSQVSPADMLRAWARVGARVVSHVRAPGARTGQRVETLIERMAMGLSKGTFPRPSGLFADEELFAIVYASGVRPPETTRFERVAVYVADECGVVAFVACASRRINPLVWVLERLLFVALAAALFVAWALLIERGVRYAQDWGYLDSPGAVMNVVGTEAAQHADAQKSAQGVSTHSGPSTVASESSGKAKPGVAASVSATSKKRPPKLPKPPNSGGTVQVNNPAGKGGGKTEAPPADSPHQPSKQPTNPSADSTKPPVASEDTAKVLEAVKKPNDQGQQGEMGVAK